MVADGPASALLASAGAPAVKSTNSQLLANMDGTGSGSGFFGCHFGFGAAVTVADEAADAVGGSIGLCGSGKTRGGSESTCISEPGSVSP